MKMAPNNALNHPEDDNDLHAVRGSDLVVRLDRPFTNEISVDIGNSTPTIFKGEMTCRMNIQNNLDIIDATIRLSSGIYAPQAYGGSAYSPSWTVQAIVSICSPYHLNGQDGLSDTIRAYYRHELSKKAITQGNTYPKAELLDQIFNPLERQLAQFYLDYSNISDNGGN